ncbi:MAG: 50S ribosomal protein L17 [Planctomycetota bacterium]
MRHRERRGKLTVTPAHQLAMGRNMVASLFHHGRVTTTVAKAKAFRPFAERLITLARRGNRGKAAGSPAGKAAYLHTVRRAARLLPHKPALRRLFEVVAPAVGDRAGGYTRILRLASRRLGDNAPKALWMLVDRPAPPPAEGPAAGKAEAETAPPRKQKGRKAPRKTAAAV